MKRHELDDLAAFALVAEERSFTRAAQKLGMSSSGLSHTVRLLEERLGVRLLSRTTRSVSTTEAGERLLQIIRPAFEDIDRGLQSLGELRGKPSGTVRITSGKHAAALYIAPVLPSFRQAYPDIRVELIVDDRLVDIVASRFDAGVRFGDQIAKDMIGVRISPDMRTAVVGAPSYFAERSPPLSPKDLIGHDCINYYMPTAGTPYRWEFVEAGRDIEMGVHGGLVFNDLDLLLDAALAGQGLSYLSLDLVDEHLKAGRLVKVLEDWCPSFTGYHLYYPGRRQLPPALAAFIDAVRFKPDAASKRSRSGRKATDA